MGTSKGHGMGQNADRLLAYAGNGEGYALAYEEIRDVQIAAMNERLQERVDKVKLVALRARDAGVSQISKLEDAIPLLLPHTAYKSYPESFLTEGRWDRLTKWLGTVTSYPTDNIDLSGVEDIDGWVAACENAGHLVSCSSGTTGKSAMLVSSRADIEFSCRDSICAVEWGSLLRRGDGRTPAGAKGAVAYTPRNAAMGLALMQAFTDPAKAPTPSGIPPITVGSITKMIALRKAIADGTARPGEIAEYEAEAEARESALKNAAEQAVEEMIEKRGERLFITGMWGSLYPLAEGVRQRGFSGADFHPENAVYLGGGLKRAQLPDNYREYVFETFNLQPEYIFQMYSMQELSSSMPRCQKGQRYHLPPWLVALPLNKNGDALVEGVGKGEVEGRAAFFDLSLDARWGGVISGDRVEIDFSPCVCGNKSPSIRDNIARYADLEGDDKIGCAGTVDAYVRGLA